MCLFQALSLIGDRRNKEAAERLEKEKELQKVAVKKDDIELIVSLHFSLILEWADVMLLKISKPHSIYEYTMDMRLSTFVTG